MPGSAAAWLPAASSSGSSSRMRAPQCSTMKRISGAARRVLTAHSAPCEAGTPKCASSSSRRLSESIATRSPGLHAELAQGVAEAPGALGELANVTLRSPSRTAMRSG